MKTYQITVSFKNKFLFRTDWDDNKDRVKQVFDTLKVTFPREFKIRVSSRDTAMQDDTYLFEAEK